MNSYRPRYQPKRVGRARKNFLKKVQILEGWVKQGGAPDEYKVPDGPLALASWQDMKLGIEKWSSPNVASPSGPHSDLRSRFDRAVDVLRPKEAIEHGETLKKQFAVLKGVVQSLAEQNTELLEKNSMLEGELIRVKQLHRLVQERESDAVRKLSSIAFIRPTKHSEG